jgi:hypothetical protein
MRFYGKSYLICLVFTAGLSALSAATIYDESVSCDLSNSGLAPTQLTVGAGSNEIFGTTGNSGSGIDRDYFTITIDPGLELDAITVLPGTESGGAVSFIGLEAGPQVTLPTNAPTAAGLLGWWHYGPADINTDILSEMAVPDTGSSGFTDPLEAGTYSFWIQDFNSGTFNYGFDLSVGAAPTPEPSTYVLAIAALAMIVSVGRMRVNGAN